MFDTCVQYDFEHSFIDALRLIHKLIDALRLIHKLTY